MTEQTTEPKLGINIGCGLVNFKHNTPDMTWINCDADPKVPASWRGELAGLHRRFLGQADEIIADDILEHIPYAENNQSQWIHTLQSWVWCLKRGGTLRIQVPSLKCIYEALDAGEIDDLTANRVIFGERTGPWDTHYQLFDGTRLCETLQGLGMEIVAAAPLHVNVVIKAVRR